MERVDRKVPVRCLIQAWALLEEFSAEKKKKKRRLHCSLSEYGVENSPLRSKGGKSKHKKSRWGEPIRPCARKKLFDNVERAHRDQGRLP